MNGQKTAGRQDRTLNALFTFVADEAVQVREVPKLLLVARGLGPRRQGFAHLGDQDADFVGRHLDPGKFFHPVEEAPFETNPRHQEFRLITGLALEGDGIVAGELPAKPLHHQTHFRRSNRPDGLPDNKQEHGHKRQACRRQEGMGQESGHGKCSFY